MRYDFSYFDFRVVRPDKNSFQYAIEGGYCGYTGMKKDRALVPLAGLPEFNDLLSKAQKCQDNFRIEMAKADSRN